MATPSARRVPHDTANIGAAGVVTVDTGQQIRTLNNAGRIIIDAFGLNLVSSGSTTNAGIIDVGGASTANLGVSAGHNIDNTGGVINIADGSVVNQFGSSISGGTINGTAAGALVVFSSSANFLNAVTLDGVMDMASNANSRQRITGGLLLGGSANINGNGILSFEGTSSLAGGGALIFGSTGAGNRIDLDGNGTTTFAAGTTVRGHSGTIGQQLNIAGTQLLVNNGTISADVAGGTINITDSAVTNHGMLSAQNGGTLLLSSPVSGGAGGQIVAGAGSQVRQNGVAISGTVNTSGSGLFSVTSSPANFLDGVTFNGGLDMASIANSRERVKAGGLVLNGVIDLNQNAILSFEGNGGLTGNASLVLGATGAGNRIDLDGNGTTTFGSGVAVRGQNGTIGQQTNLAGTQVLVNNGSIVADVAGGTITITDSAVTNNGTLGAQNGGTLVLNSAVAGSASGQIVVGAGSQVRQAGVAISGTVNTSGSGLFSVTSSPANFLTGVALNGNLDMTSIANSRERVNGGSLALNGTVSLNGNGILSFEGDGTFSGTGSIVLGNTGAGNRVDLDGNGTTTFEAGVTVRGHSGTIGQQLNIAGTQTLVNNGTISADTAGGTITITDSAVSNNGTLSAQNGGILVLSSNVQGSAAGQIVAGAGSQVRQNGVLIGGVINTSGGGLFSVTSSPANFLTGVTFNGNLDMASIANSRERVSAGGMTLNGSISLNLNGGLSFEGDGTFSGTGSVVFGSTGAGNQLYLDGNGTTTLASGITVRGENGSIGNQLNLAGTQVLLNNGLVSADVSGGTIHITDSAVTNNARLEARNGGTLVLGSAVTQGGSGVILADGGTVTQSGVRITGGRIDSANSGALRVTSNSQNVLDAVTIGGVVDMATLASSRQRVNNGLTVNGLVNINGNGILGIEGTSTIGGTGAVVLGNSGAGNRIDLEGNGTTTFGSNLTVRGHSGVIGQQLNIAGTQTLVNNGTINAELGGGTISFVESALVNHGLLRAQAGTMSVGVAMTGTGTLQVDASGVMNLANGAKSQGTLTMGAAGANLNLNLGDLTLGNDYTNAAWGSGNSFNRRAGITGAGQVLAGGDVSQIVVGAGVTNGTTANATLTIGNVRVGTTAFAYQLANAGTTGPTLRGAIQTTVNGASLTDTRLGGTGVAPGLYNAGAPGFGSGDLSVSFSVASAGPVAPLTGQVLNFRSNFENMADQKLNIVVGAGAAAFNAAVGSATPTPVQLAAQRLGGSLSQTLTVINTAPAGAFSEDLNAQFGASTGLAQASGAVSGVLAGGSSGGSGSLVVGVDTSVAGAHTGSVSINFTTAGAVAGVSNGLGEAPAGTQTLQVAGHVYAPATPQLGTPAVNFGIVRVGDVVAARNVAVANTSSGALTDTLRASLSGGALPFSAAGTAAAVAAGSGDASSLNVALDTSVAGVYSSSAVVSFTSQNPEMADLPLGTAAVGLSAQVNNLAATSLAHAGAGSFSGGVLSYTLDFGTVLAGVAGGTATLNLTNSASAGSPADALAGLFDLGALQPGDPFALGGFAGFSGLAAGSSLDSLTVSFGGVVEGSFDRVLVLNRLSTNGSGPDLTLAPVELRLIGSVTAVPEPGTWAMWLAGLAMLGDLLRRRARRQG